MRKVTYCELCTRRLDRGQTQREHIISGKCRSTSTISERQQMREKIKAAHRTAMNYGNENPKVEVDEELM